MSGTGVDFLGYENWLLAEARCIVVENDNFPLESEQWRLINEEKVQASHQKHHNHEQVSESNIGELSLKIYTVTL